MKKEIQEKIIICDYLKGMVCIMDGYKCDMWNGYHCIPKKKAKRLKDERKKSE